MTGDRSVFGPEDGSEQQQSGLEAVTTRRIVKARGYGGLAPGEALARALGVAIALGCISPRRSVRASACLPLWLREPCRALEASPRGEF